MSRCTGQEALDVACEWMKHSNNAELIIQSYEIREGFRFLLLTAGFDLCYYHELELEFQEVSHIDLPTRFEGQRVRRATPEERAAFHQTVGIDDEDTLFVFEARNVWPGPDTGLFHVVAQEVTATSGLVFHYLRENLKEGESIAPWVLK
jgi:hypothetical protein